MKFKQIEVKVFFAGKAVFMRPQTIICIFSLQRFWGQIFVLLYFSSGKSKVTMPNQVQGEKEGEFPKHDLIAERRNELWKKVSGKEFESLR